MYGTEALTVLTGKVLEVSGQSFMLAPGTRVELPPDHAGGLEVGQHVLVRARRVRGRYVAESVLPDKASGAARCAHCGTLLTRDDLEDECTACYEASTSAEGRVG